MRLLLVTRVITAQSIMIKVNKSDHVTISTNPLSAGWLGIAPHRLPGQVYYFQCAVYLWVLEDCNLFDILNEFDYNILTKTVEEIAQTYPPRRKIKKKLSEIAA